MSLVTDDPVVGVVVAAVRANVLDGDGFLSAGERTGLAVKSLSRHVEQFRTTGPVRQLLAVKLQSSSSATLVFPRYPQRLTSAAHAGILPPVRSGQRSSRSQGRRPPNHELPQQRLTATLRRSKTRPGWYLTFQLPNSGLVERHVIVPIPQGVVDGSGAEGERGPVYLRYYVDDGMADAPGTNEVTEVRGRVPEAQALEEVVLAESDSRREPDGDFDNEDTPTSPETPIALDRS